MLFQLMGKSRFPPKKFYNIDYWSAFHLPQKCPSSFCASMVTA